MPNCFTNHLCYFCIPLSVSVGSFCTVSLPALGVGIITLVLVVVALPYCSFFSFSFFVFCVWFSAFYFEIVLDSQKCCKDSVESCFSICPTLLAQWFSTKSYFACKGPLIVAGNIFGCHILGAGDAIDRHLAGSWGHYLTPWNIQEPPQQRTIYSKMSVVLRAGNAALRFMSDRNMLYLPRLRC